MVLVAVDVGTTSARAGVLTDTGAPLSRVTHPILIRRMGATRAEHNSTDIWRAVCAAVRQALQSAGVRPADVAGIGFDATCSLVVRDRAGAPLTVSEDGEPGFDTIVWLDHRALAETHEANATGHAVLDHSGGALSPEMEVPKLAWLKRNRPELWRDAGKMFDLADFLTHMATGSLARSQSTLTSKWTFLAHKTPGFQADFFEAMGLDDLIEKAGLPETASPIGADLGPLSEQAASQLGLTTACRVATGMVDAHAGALGVLGAFSGASQSIHRHLGLVAGTSSAVMALSREPRPVAGVWGPYFGAVLPGVWLSEGGQSASGALLDHIVATHAKGAGGGAAMHGRIAARIAQMQAGTDGDIAPRLHVLPDFHGNRSPFADPDALGAISGLALDDSFDGLCRLYWRTAVAIALGVRHILETLNGAGFAIDNLHVSGGHTRNPVLMRLYADATGCTVHELPEADAMLLGNAIGAATAAGLYPSLVDAATAFKPASVARRPDPAMRARYDRDYAVFLKLHEHRRELDRM